MEGPARLLGVTVYAQDVEAAATFYRDVVGVAVEAERHGDGPLHFHAGWGFPDRGLMFTIWPGETRQPQRIDFVVPDVDLVHERATETGAGVISEPGRSDTGAPPGWRDCALRDPVGNVVGIYQEPA